MQIDYDRQMWLLNRSLETNLIPETDYQRIFEMLIETDYEDYTRLGIICDDLIQAIADHKKQKISDRLVKGAELIESTPDPKEKARLMVHYNNLLKELGA